MEHFSIQKMPSWGTLKSQFTIYWINWLKKLPVANRLHKSPKNIHQSTKRLIGIRKASIYKGFSDWPLQLRATNNQSESFPLFPRYSSSAPEA